MSVVFVVANEKQLQTGIQWCKRMVERSSGRPTIHLLVADSDRKTLAEYIKRKVGELSDSSVAFTSAIVGKEVRDVLSYATSVKCEKLLLLYHPDEFEFQQSLFKESMCPAVWIRSGSEDSVPTARLIGMFHDGAHVTDLAAQQLFGQPPAEMLNLDSEQESEDFPALIMAAAESQSIGPSDLLLCGCPEAVKTDRAYAAGIAFKRVERGADGPSGL